MEQYPSNSINKRREQMRKDGNNKHLEPVVKTPVVTRKKSEIKKFADEFITESVSKVNNHIFKDILFPSINEIAWKILTDSINMVFYPNETKRSSVPADRVSYKNYQTGGNIVSPVRDYRATPESNRHIAPDEYIFTDRGSAEIVLYRLQEELKHYGTITVSDFKQLAGIQEEYTDNNFGWDSLSSAKILPTNGGYRIRLPKPSPIDQI